jgi:hypothetical protein
MSDRRTQYETVGSVLSDREAIRKELAAARALLREVLEKFDPETMAQDELWSRITSYLDACDTLAEREKP